MDQKPVNSTPAPVNQPTPAPAQQNIYPPQPATQYAPAPAPAAQNQGSVMALVISLMALTAVIIFFVLKMQPNRSGYDPELDSLRSQVDQKRISLGLSGSSDTTTGLTAESLTGRISTDADSLAALMREITDRLAAKDGEIALKNNEIMNATKARESLLADIAALQKRLDEARRNSTDSSVLELQLKDTRMLLDSANSQIARLKASLSEAPSSETLRLLKDDLARAEEEIARLKDSLGNLPDSDTVSELQRENRRLRLELQALQADANRNRLFAENTDLLSSQALALFNQLTALEGSSNEARLHSYDSIKEQLGARVVETVSFSTGAANIDIEKVGVIQNSLKSTSGLAEYLIVGYASKSGDITTNRELSSKRATTVATIADLERGKNQIVKAVFLGQTDRFSKSNDYSNQICEVWEILPKK